MARARERAKKYYYSPHGQKKVKEYRRKLIESRNSSLEAKEAARTRWREYGKIHHGGPENKNRRKGYALWFAYGLTYKDFEEMVRRQNGLCLICGMADQKLCVDHCHKTGAIRGLLCQKCNHGIGLFKDDPARIANAANYVSRDYTSARKIPSFVKESA